MEHPSTRSWLGGQSGALAGATGIIRQMSRRWRRFGSIALLAAGLVALFGATITLYAEDRILDGDRFADGALATLDDPDVERFVSTRITVRVIDRIDPDLVSFKPLIESAVASLLETPAFRAALRQGLLAAHGAVFDRDLDSAAIAVRNVGALVRPVLEEIDPALASEVPHDLDVGLARVADQPVLVDAAQIADTFDRWAGILPGLAILLLGVSVLAVERRRRASIRCGLSIVVLAAVSIVALAVARVAVLDRAGQPDVAAAIWDAFLGDLSRWELALAGVGVMIATAAAALLRTYDLHEPLRRAWSRAVHEPSHGAARVLWALALAAVGLMMALAPGEVLRATVVVVGVYLLARAVSTAVGAIAEARGWSLDRLEAASSAARARDPIDVRRVLTIGAVVVLASSVAVGAGLSALLRDDGGQPAVAKPTGECNGARALCDRSLEEVAFLATHNSYAGTGYPGFLFPEQQGTISSQLRDGVRGLWIDTYYGVPGRRVYTLTDLIDPALNAQLKAELGPQFEAAAARLRSEIAEPPADAPRRIYLCHGFCELGAVEAGDAFRAIARFLAQNPEEVLIVDIEDYTRPKDTVALIERTGLADYVYEGPDGPPWPTLREMVDSGRRLLLVVEHRTAGAPRWYRPAYRSVFQETPFRFKTPAQMSCAPGRGSPSNSLFLINNWIDTDPTPKPSNAAKVNAYDFLLGRARRCERERDRFPNVLNVDFFAEGQPERVIASLNGGGD